MDTATRDIFLEALDLSPSERRAFLESLGVNNPALRKRVEELLAENEKLADFLDMPAARPTFVPDGPSPAKPGDQIGRYRLLEQIGEGGAGVVFMAEQFEPVRRRVALKVLKLGMDTRQVVARFEAERQALAMMDHRNIAAVFDAGATETGRPYFVMELVRGTPVTTYCDQRNLPVQARLKLFIQICHAIQHAHQKGIIHRDIKPSNILVTESEGGAIPKVIDFGIAKAIEQPLTEKTLFTEFRSLVGTPAYMSPEQLDMAGADVDTRSDIYSLGVLLYEMLIGQTPFAAKSLMQSGVDEFRRNVREVEPERPSTRGTRLPEMDLTTTATQRQLDNRSLLRLLRGELDWIAMKCLEKDRSRRYATVNDLTADVERYLLREPILARPPSSAYRVQKFLRRHQIAVGAAAIVALALISASIVSMRQAALARDAKRIAEAERTRAQVNEARALLNEYVADVTLAQQALSAGNFGRASFLLGKHIPQPGKADLRGFEWGHLSRLTEGDPHQVLIESGESVRSVAFSADGKFVAIGARDLATVLNANDRSVVGVSTGGVFSVAFGADNARLYIADFSSVRALDLRDRSTRALATGVGAPIAVSSDGQLLAAASREGKFPAPGSRDGGGVRIFSTDPWAGKHTIFRASGPFAFSPTSDALLAGGEDGFAFWPLRGKSDPVAFSVQPQGGFFHRFARTIAIAPDASRFYAVQDRILSVIDAKSGVQIATIPADGKPLQVGAISSVALSPDGKLIATGSWDHSIQLWDTEHFTQVRSLKGHLNEVWSVAFSPDGKTVLSGAKDGGVFLWPIAAQNQIDFIQGDWQPLAFSSDEKTLAAVNRRNGAVGVIDVETAAVEELLSANPSALMRFGAGPPIARVSVSADLTMIARQTRDRVIEITDRRTNQKVSLPGDEAVTHTVFSHDGKALLALTWGGSPVYWDLAAMTNVPISVRSDRGFFTPDSKHLLLVNRDGAATLWSCVTHAVENSFTLEMPAGFAGGAISPDGRTFAAGAMPELSNTIMLIDIFTGKTSGTLAGHKQGVGPVAFSADGRTLVSTSSDGSLKFWNIPTQQEILTFPAQAANVVFSPGGHYLAFSVRTNNSEGIQLLRTATPHGHRLQ